MRIWSWTVFLDFFITLCRYVCNRMTWYYESFSTTKKLLNFILIDMPLRFFVKCQTVTSPKIKFHNDRFFLNNWVLTRPVTVPSSMNWFFHENWVQWPVIFWRTGYQFPNWERNWMIQTSSVLSWGTVIGLVLTKKKLIILFFTLKNFSCNFVSQKF